MNPILKAIKDGLEVSKTLANDYKIIRNNQVIGTVKAFLCNSEFPDTIQTLEPTKIFDNDILELHNIKYLIVDAEPQIRCNELCYYMCKFENKKKLKNDNQEIHNYNFNAPLSGNTVIGSQHSFTLNIDNSINNIQEIINNKTEDKEALQNMLNEIIETSKNDKPLTKGMFSKFSKLLSKHSDIAIAVGGFLEKLLF